MKETTIQLHFMVIYILLFGIILFLIFYGVILNGLVN